MKHKYMALHLIIFASLARFVSFCTCKIWNKEIFTWNKARQTMSTCKLARQATIQLLIGFVLHRLIINNFDHTNVLWKMPNHIRQLFNTASLINMDWCYIILNYYTTRFSAEISKKCFFILIGYGAFLFNFIFNFQKELLNIFFYYCFICSC